MGRKIPPSIYRKSHRCVASLGKEARYRSSRRRRGVAQQGFLIGQSLAFDVISVVIWFGSMFNRRRFLATSIVAAGITGTGISPAVWESAAELGRLVIAGFRGTVASDPEIARVLRYLEASQIAGVILLKQNITTPDQLLKL